MTLCIIQARMGSTRLPNKVLLEVAGVSMLEYEIRRLRNATRIDRIVVATTTNPEDEQIVSRCAAIGVDCFRGSSTDVLDRYVQCLRAHPGYDTVLRVTGDCPLIDPAVIDTLLAFFAEQRLDYASNVEAGKESYPDGIDAEVFTRAALERAAKEAHKLSEREHVTPYIRNTEAFKKGSISAPWDFSHFRLTLDEPSDFEVIRFVIEQGEPSGYLGCISLLTKHPDIMVKNMHIIRNEGLLKSLRQDASVTKPL